jgi:putative tryptophan/tyrosine transport system substrate-binding protein
MAAEYDEPRLGRRRLLQGAGAIGLGLLVGCGRVPWQAQAPTKLYHIGFLHDAALSAADDPSQAETLFRQGLRDLGYVEGHNVIVEARYTQGDREMRAAAAAELARMPVDIFVTLPLSATQTAREASSTIPIVHVLGGGGLVDSGLAASLARPGGNVTGLDGIQTELVGKWIELLKAVAPDIRRVVALLSTNYRPMDEAASRALGVEVQYFVPAQPTQLEAALDTLGSQAGDALLTVFTPWTLPIRQQIVDLANERRAPSIYDNSAWVDMGGLMAYSARLGGNAQRAALFVDKILKGANPADLPIELPMNFFLKINLRTAQALGLDIPQYVLLQATELIQ